MTKLVINDNKRLCTTLNYYQKPLIYVKKNEPLIIETLNAFGIESNSEIELENFMKSGYHHPVSGPIHLKGLKKEDTLKVYIDKIKLKEYAYQCNSHSSGVLKNLFSKRNYKRYKIDRDYLLMDDMYIKLEPSIGIIGVADPDECRTGRCCKYGGNLDINVLKENSTIYLPTSIDGGNLYLGDVHAYQGMGEVSGIALESSANITIRLDTANFKINCPMIVDNKNIYMIGYGTNILSAIEKATYELSLLLKREKNISFLDAYQMVGAIGDCMIGNLTGKISTAAIRLKKYYANFDID